MGEDHPMIPLEEAWALVEEALGGRAAARETVPVRAAQGRLLAADQHARLELPPFDKSAMDGYAILAGDVRTEYRLLETVAAGQTPSAELLPGTTVKVMTGAPVPAGTGMVVMWEVTEEAGGTVRVLRHEGKCNIRLRGEDVRVGDRVLSAGCVLDALDLANLIACGISDVPVAPRLRLAVLSTGDEIADDPADLRPGKIMNTNGPMLAHLAGANGLTVVAERTIPDDLEQTVAALREALAAADVVVLSGGVSVGDFDYVLDAFRQVGLTVHFSRIAVKPGKPTVFATAGEKAVFGLPGNPVSVCLMFHLFVVRAARLLCGVPASLREFRLPLAGDFRRRNADRLQFSPARLTETGAVEPLAYHGSAHLLSLAAADGFFSVPAGVTDLPAGEPVTYLDLREPYA